MNMDDQRTSSERSSTCSTTPISSWTLSGLGILDPRNLFKSGEVDVAAGWDRSWHSGSWMPAPPPNGRRRMMERSHGLCGFAITSDAKNIPAAYALMNWQSSPEAQAIRARSGYLVTNRKALDLVPQATAGPSGADTAEVAIPETYPPSYYPDWIQAFKDVKSQ